MLRTHHLCLCCFFFFKQKTAYEMLRSLVGSEMCIRDRYQRRVRGQCCTCMEHIRRIFARRQQHGNLPGLRFVEPNNSDGPDENSEASDTLMSEDMLRRLRLVEEALDGIDPDDLEDALEEIPVNKMPATSPRSPTQTKKNRRRSGGLRPLEPTHSASLTDRRRREPGGSPEHNGDECTSSPRSPRPASREITPTHRRQQQLLVELRRQEHLAIAAAKAGTGEWFGTKLLPELLEAPERYVDDPVTLIRAAAVARLKVLDLIADGAVTPGNLRREVHSVVEHMRAEQREMEGMLLDKMAQLETRFEEGETALREAHDKELAHMAQGFEHQLDQVKSQLAAVLQGLAESSVESPSKWLSAGLSAAKSRHQGFSVVDCYQAGYSILQCRQAGYTAQECRGGGMSAGQCHQGGFRAHECRLAGYTATECKEAGYSVCECEAGGVLCVRMSGGGMVSCRVQARRVHGGGMQRCRLQCGRLQAGRLVGTRMQGGWMVHARMQGCVQRPLDFYRRCRGCRDLLPSKIGHPENFGLSSVRPGGLTKPNPHPHPHPLRQAHEWRERGSSAVIAVTALTVIVQSR
eukprot:TRINITY_DN14594_c0_g1_i1.p1 TRINITY_DN14594_c0_g1~~TRINITY_DN14594_c0_g1_i1.p1  ORF type:complete len:576 (+),score=105.86 TRINITY_DN14594_c0_g1_i1:22-1749(+)